MMEKQKDRILVLGAGVMQGPVLRIARELGLFTVAVDGDPHAVSASMADRFEVIDLKDREGIEQFGRSLVNEGLCGIMTAGTDFSASVAWAAERLGLPGIPYEAALNASDKERMRSCFKKAGIPSPEFTIVTSPPEKELSEKGLSYPLVVKPVDNMGGRGCRRAGCFAELREAAEESLRFSRSGRAIVESFMEGPEFSVDAIVYHGEITICGLADRHIFFPPYFIEMGHTLPARVENEKQRLLLETFTAGVRALGIAGENCCGAAKGDIKLTPHGPMVGEIAARLSGGYMSGWTYPYASGAESVKGAILAALGKKPEGISPVRSWTCAERAFISIPGTVKEVVGIEKARSIRFVKDLFLRTESGKEVSFPENNVGKCGNVIAAAPGRESAVSAAEKAAAAVLIRLKAPDSKTSAFLAQTASSAQAFPPGAFSLTPPLRALLDRMPDPDPVPAEDGGNFTVLDFPEFSASGLKDYAGRTVEESLEAVRRLTKIKTAPAAAGRDGICRGIIGRRFWSALIRGGYQGAVYVIDEVLEKAGYTEKGGT
jgi:biotin carboxylase